MKRRSDSYFGLHFDFHASPQKCKAPIGSTLKEEDIREICRLLKPDFLQIDCKGHAGWASYPSECGNAMENIAGDPLKTWRRVTREEGVALYLHYSGVIDQRYCLNHPDESIMRADGSRIIDGASDAVSGCTRTNGRYADELLIPQIKELAGKYGVDGVWVDGECWGAHADFHPDTVRAFEEETGVNLNGRLPSEPSDEHYEEYREFCRELFRRYVRHYVDAVHADYPDFQIASNWAYSDHMPEPVTANVDFISGDLSPQNSFNSARYAGRAIAQQNRTWDLMSWNFRSRLADTPGPITKHPIQIIQEAAAVISLGGGFQNYITQYPDGSPRMDQIRGMKAVADFMREREPYCFRGRAVHQVAVLLSTWNWHRGSKSLFTRYGFERNTGLTALLCDAGHSTEIVSEHTIKGRCPDYPVIIVPELPHGLADETIAELMEYAENGGNLVLIGEKTLSLFEKAGAPYSLGELTEDAAVFTLDGLRFGNVSGFRTVTAEGETCANAALTQRDDGKPLACVIPYGKGKISAVCFDLGNAYYTSSQYLHRTLIKTLLDKLYSPIVRLDSVEGKLEVTVLKKDGRMMIQLVNANGDHSNTRSASEDFIPACHDISLSIALVKVPAHLILRPAGKELDFTFSDGRAAVRIPKIAMHDIIEVVE
ncbi:MAG: alpha-L-fucosidase [Clostridia bacterium]|nr:alpha-L-fucosidase [Clostridia bacterium]